MTEEFKSLLANLLGIVKSLEHGTLVELAPYLVEFLRKVVVTGCNLPLLIHLRQGCCLKHLEHKDCVVRRNGTSALGNDVGVWDAVLVGCIYHCVNGIVYILLYRVVDTALAA